jgi:pimeloyl-ACP methyl ester carboxylesterase
MRYIAAMADDSTRSLHRWRETARIHRHRGHAIAYHDEGEGPALLVIHGFPSAAWDFRPLWSELRARFRVVAPDLLGFGDSDKPRDHDYSIADQADMITGLLAELGVTRVHVLAHDYGDTVAQELLARHEAQLRRGEPGLALASICFLNGGLFPESHRPRPIQRLLASPLGALVGRFTSKRTFVAGLTAIFGPRTPPGRELLDELWTLFTRHDGQRVTHRIIGYMAERRRHRERWVGPLRSTAVPLRFIDGMLDPVSGAHMVARYRELVPDPDVVELANVGHYPQIEDPAAVRAAFLAFHARIAGRDETS